MLAETWAMEVQPTNSTAVATSRAPKRNFERVGCFSRATLVAGWARQMSAGASFPKVWR